MPWSLIKLTQYSSVYTFHIDLIESTESFPGVKRPGAWLWSPAPFGAEFKERVELYLYSPSGWPVIGRTLPLPSRGVKNVPIIQEPSPNSRPQNGDVNQYWAPKIMKWTVKRTAYWPVLLGACELLHISVYKKRTTIIMLKVSGSSIRSSNCVLIVRTMTGILLAELNIKWEVPVWTHKGPSSIVKTCYYARIKSSVES